MIHTLDPFDDAARPLDNEKQKPRRHDDAVPNTPPEGPEAVVKAIRDSNFGADDGAPPSPFMDTPGPQDAWVRALLKSLFDYALALHLMPSKEFYDHGYEDGAKSTVVTEGKATRLKNGELPSEVLENLQPFVANAALCISDAPVQRRTLFARLGNGRPVSVAEKHGFLSVYQEMKNGYTVRVTRIHGGETYIFQIPCPTAAELLEAVLAAVIADVRAALFAADEKEALARLRALLVGHFSPDVVRAVLTVILFTGGYCKGGFPSRNSILRKHDLVFMHLLPTTYVTGQVKTSR
ncbi:MAG TPA: hypothetical protein VNV15_00495 [Opitutaceae bacterium]|jgi:hypothetical protein|nr:hypothetical protein [Opitutaceae bacterium]